MIQQEECYTTHSYVVQKVKYQIIRHVKKGRVILMRSHNLINNYQICIQAKWDYIDQVQSINWKAHMKLKALKVCLQYNSIRKSSVIRHTFKYIFSFII